MKFGIVGLGRIGRNIALQALEKGHEVVGFNRSQEKTRELEKDGLIPAFRVDELVQKLGQPRIILIYLPHGEPTEQAIDSLVVHMEQDDIIVDGRNSHWKAAVKRQAAIRETGIHLLDVGTSGGVEGARHGACFMVGGDQSAFTKVEPLLKSLAVPDGVLHAGPSGAGHFVKLIHNAIEFGMVQAIAEGLNLLKQFDHGLDFPAIFHNWNHGSVIRSWLIELMERGLREQDIGDVSHVVEDTREVKWAVQFALEKEAWIPVISQSELALYAYRHADSLVPKGVALLRHMFGEHPLPK